MESYLMLDRELDARVLPAGEWKDGSLVKGYLKRGSYIRGEKSIRAS
jgi:hypothetical protein